MTLGLNRLLAGWPDLSCQSIWPNCWLPNYSFRWRQRRGRHDAANWRKSQVLVQMKRTLICPCCSHKESQNSFGVLAFLDLKTSAHEDSGTSHHMSSSANLAPFRDSAILKCWWEWSYSWCSLLFLSIHKMCFLYLQTVKPNFYLHVVLCLTLNTNHLDLPLHILANGFLKNWDF